MKLRARPDCPLGGSGRHARSAIGAGELPFGMPIEVEAVVALA